MYLIGAILLLVGGVCTLVAEGIILYKRRKHLDVGVQNSNSVNDSIILNNTTS